MDEEDIDAAVAAIQILKNRLVEVADSLKKAQEKNQKLEEDFEGRIKALENPPKGPEDWSKERLSDISPGFVENHAAVADQVLYWSTQAIKVDPSLFTIAPDVVSVGANGISVLGINVTPGFEQAVTRRFQSAGPAMLQWMRGLPGGSGGSDDGASDPSVDTGSSGTGTGADTADLTQKLKNTNIRVNGVEQRLARLRGLPRTVDRHDAVLRGLTRNQRSVAGAAATDNSRRSTAEMNQANRLSGQRGQSTNARMHVHSANQLRAVSQEMRRVEEEAARLERRLG